MTDQRPRVTVLMTVYNGERFLPAAVRSVLEQTFPNLELLVVDDGSVDATARILAQFAEDDERVRILRNARNLGRSASAALGVEHASGEFLARLDADDVSEPRRIERQVAFLEEHHDIDVVGSWATEIDERDVAVGMRRVPTEPREIRELIWANPIIHSSSMVRHEALLRIGSYDRSLPNLEDYELWFRGAASGLRMANLPEPLIRYRVAPHQWRKRKSATWRRTQLRVGWTGCWRLRLGIAAYVGVAAPVIKSLFPERYGAVAQRWFRRFDPRQRTA